MGPSEFSKFLRHSGDCQTPASLGTKVVGLDIGGANLKIANARGQCQSTYFPMWTDHRQLGERLQELLRQFGHATHTDYDRVGVTMTGEMADCFASRRAGVAFILEQLTFAFRELPIEVYTVDGGWLKPQAAKQDPWRVASSNWHALASWIVRGFESACSNVRLVVDIGSTTVDVIPVNEQGVATTARTDGDRLKLQQLVYTGISRTPIAAIISQLEIKGAPYPLVAERFATSDDAYVALGLVDADDPTADGVGYSQINNETADGRSRSVVHARARLARMLGEDAERLTADEIEQLAKQVIAAQAQKVALAIRRNLPQNESIQQPQILISGHGRALATEALKLLNTPVCSIYLDDLVSPAATRCAPAVAVAGLLEQRV